MKKILVLFCFLISIPSIKSQDFSVTPNPFNKRTLISFTISNNDTVTLFVTTLTGQNIATIYSNTPLPAGAYQDSLILDNFQSGIYYVSLKLKQGSSKVMKIIKNEPLGVQEKPQALPLNIFPNPTNGKLHLEFANIANLQIHLFNSLGQIVYTKNEIQFKQEIDLSPFVSGVYYLHVQNSTGQKVFKILRE